MRRPLAAPQLIDRPRLLRQLESALETGHILLTAPAGYGKSVALQSLVAHRRQSYHIPLSAAHRDVTVLVEQLRPFLHPQNTLLLDDIHLLESVPEAVAWLQTQLARRRPRWVLAGRRIPFDETALVVGGQATQLTKETLAFSSAESAALLGRDRRQWRQRLQGWPLALSLLARLPPDEDPLPVAEAHLFPYLAAAVFDRLPPTLKQFMQVTAVPLRFNLALAAEIWTGSEDAPVLLDEIQRRNLFIQPDGAPGWLRYHDLIRAYLLETAPFDTKPLAAQIIAAFERQEDLESAIEQALASGFPADGARLLEQVSDTFLWDHARHLTFHRWVHSLGPDVQAAHPQLLVRLAQSLHYLSGRRSEAWDTMRQAQMIYEQRDDQENLRQIQRHFAWFHMSEGAYEASLDVLNRLLADFDCPDNERLQILFQVGSARAYLGHFDQAESALDGAVALAKKADDDRLAATLGEKLALHVYTPRGRFRRAQAAMAAVEPHYAGKPSYRVQYLMIIADLYIAQGDWEALETAVHELTRQIEQLELAENHQLLWTAYYRAWLAVVQEDDDLYQSALAMMQDKTGDDPVANLCLARLQVWASRRGVGETVVSHADQMLARPDMNAAYYRAALALERDIAAGICFINGEAGDFALHPETRHLIVWRCRDDLVRLRALLAVVCHHAGNPRWRRHMGAAVFALDYPGYARLLTGRDPDLGAVFWHIALATGPFSERAAAALTTIGKVEPLLPLLGHKDAPVRARAAAVLTDMGREEALPGLAAAQTREKDAAAQRVLDTAVHRLENLPPPPLIVRCFGDFQLRRGPTLIPPEAWPRPIVYRLFCYFALHQGQTVSRERLLDDLWPETDPKKSWNTFRTIFSKLRKVLEPYLPPKTPMRYIVASGEQFIVDPADVMQVDVRDFERVVADALAKGRSHDFASTIEPLTAVLSAWEPLLPDLPLEDWLVDPRQRVQELFTEGCLLAAQTLLAQSDYEASVMWARRAVDAAPWLEEAYQTLMRAYARQGQRTLALRVHEQAAANLRQELDITPSPLTDWLVGRLRQGERI